MIAERKRRKRWRTDQKSDTQAEGDGDCFYLVGTVSTCSILGRPAKERPIGKTNFEACIMPRSYLHIKPSRNSHTRQFSWNGVGRGYHVAIWWVFVAIRGSTWLLRGHTCTWRLLEGCCAPRNSQVYPVIATRPRNYHEIATSHFISRKLHLPYTALIGRLYMKVQPWHNWNNCLAKFPF